MRCEKMLMAMLMVVVWAACGVESDTEPEECQPDCAGRECGPNGCGGSCAPGCFGDSYCNVQTGRCQTAGCTPACAGRECGPDGCGGHCPPGCGADQYCDQASWLCKDEEQGCVPDCLGRVCGTDGCGGTCGPECPAGQVCNIIVGQCETVCQPQCTDKECGPDGCGGWCPPGCGEESSCNEATGKCGPIIPDCSSCPAIGGSLENMRCAIELCDDEVYLSGDFSSPSNASTQGTHTAVARFGSQSNDLAPLMNGSYALMATGSALGTTHCDDMGGCEIQDPFSQEYNEILDVMEWRLHLKAPAGAHGFQIHYIFLSTEYDEYIGSPFNDKFYIFIEAPSTNQGSRTVINFTACRDPDTYHDFVCDASMEYCEQGERYCYVAINTALSECCWYDGCPQGTWTTDLAGTGYSCAGDEFWDMLLNGGSSTGWLVTEWFIEPEEEFDIIFHIHDTSDPILDSEVIIDKFLFVGSADPHTDPV